MDGGLGLRIAVAAALRCPPFLVAVDRAIVAFLRTAFFSDSILFGELLNSFFLAILGLHCLLTPFLRSFRSFISARRRFISGVEVASMGLPRFRAHLVTDLGGA